MKPEFNYESVPFDFSHCFCGQCKVADKCLRHQVALRIPESRYSVPVINPNNVSPDGEKLPDISKLIGWLCTDWGSAVCLTT